VPRHDRRSGLLSLRLLCSFVVRFAIAVVAVVSERAFVVRFAIVLNSERAFAFASLSANSQANYERNSPKPALMKNGRCPAPFDNAACNATNAGAAAAVGRSRTPHRQNPTIGQDPRLDRSRISLLPPCCGS